MYLAVFQEFKHSAVLDRVLQIPLCVDVAANPCSFAKTDAEVETVTTNAKLMVDPSTSDAEVDATVAKLVELGFAVVLRNPVTSAGCPMKDRVILKFAH